MSHTSAQRTWTSDSLLDFLRTHRTQLRALGVRRIGLFGSYARDEASADSDVDLLFTMDDFSWAGWMDVWNFLEDHLGLSVDLIPEKDLREELRPHVMADIHYVET